MSLLLISSITIILFLFVFSAFLIKKRRIIIKPKTFIPHYSYVSLKQYIEPMPNYKQRIVPINLPKATGKVYKLRRFIIKPPPYVRDQYGIDKRHIANGFKYKSWDGTYWTAYIIDGSFYVKQMGTSRLLKTLVINILRFRSQQWQVAYDTEKNMFMVFRFNGITGIPYKLLDLINWSDYSYQVEPYDEIIIET